MAGVDNLTVHVQIHPRCLTRIIGSLSSFHELVKAHAAEKADSDLMALAQEYEAEVEKIRMGLVMEDFIPPKTLKQKIHKLIQKLNPGRKSNVKKTATL